MKVFKVYLIPWLLHLHFVFWLLYFIIINKRLLLLTFEGMAFREIDESKQNFVPAR